MSGVLASLTNLMTFLGECFEFKGLWYLVIVRRNRRSGVALSRVSLKMIDLWDEFMPSSVRGGGSMLIDHGRSRPVSGCRKFNELYSVRVENDQAEVSVAGGTSNRFHSSVALDGRL